MQKKGRSKPRHIESQIGITVSVNNAAKEYLKKKGIDYKGKA